MQHDVFVRIKRLYDDVILPEYKTDEAACADIYAYLKQDLIISPMSRVLVSTGFSIALNQGWEAQIRSRSGMTLNYGLVAANAPGTIDSDYRGEVKVILQNLSDIEQTVKHGDRIAQMSVKPVYRIRWLSDDISDITGRGPNGFGSTGV